MILQVRGIFKTGAVQTLQHRTCLVALVKSARDAHQLEGLAVPGAADVRAGAEIPEVAVFIKGYFLSRGNVVKKIHLECAGDTTLRDKAQSPVQSQGHGLVAADHNTFEGVVVLHHLFHFLLDFGKIIRGDAVLQIHVVIEAVLHRWACGELHVVPQPRYRRRHDMGAGMAEAVQIGHLMTLF